MDFENLHEHGYNIERVDYGIDSHVDCIQNLDPKTGFVKKLYNREGGIGDYPLNIATEVIKRYIRDTALLSRYATEHPKDFTFELAQVGNDIYSVRFEIVPQGGVIANERGKVSVLGQKFQVGENLLNFIRNYKMTFGTRFTVTSSKFQSSKEFERLCSLLYQENWLLATKQCTEKLNEVYRKIGKGRKIPPPNLYVVPANVVPYLNKDYEPFTVVASVTDVAANLQTAYEEYARQLIKDKLQ